MKGGYKIIDLKNTPLTSGQEASIEGLFENVKNTYKKALMVSGLTVSDISYPDFFAVFIADSENMTSNNVIGGSQVSITITPDDNITVTVGNATLNTVKKTATK